MSAVNEKELAASKQSASDGVPGYAVEITKGLFIGNQIAALNCKALVEQGITDILIVARLKPQFEDTFNYRVIELDDSFSVDLLSCLDETRKFIDNALSANNECSSSSSTTSKKRAVLVHDETGYSNAAAVVVAYVMASQSLTYHEAFQVVYKHYPSCAKMNLGLTHQLKSYQKLKCVVNGYSEVHLRHRVERLGCLMLEKHFVDAKLLAPDPSNFSYKLDDGDLPSNAVAQKDFKLDADGKPIIASVLNPNAKEKTQSSANTPDKAILYSCQACKRALFLSENRFPIDHSVQLAEMGGGECMYHFIEPMSWMGSIDAAQGWIWCPGCKEMLGQFNWHGMDCCAISFSEPAFGIQKFSVSSQKIVELNR
mmetsp:Transcript_17967/g.26750  ORF Transcript_17967/g.26750 Transcript_17967/m.26750 type:complete len:369 (+) Transcript_17967:21-1127(+)